METGCASLWGRWSAAPTAKGKDSSSAVERAALSGDWWWAAAWDASTAVGASAVPSAVASAVAWAAVSVAKTALASAAASEMV